MHNSFTRLLIIGIALLAGALRLGASIEGAGLADNAISADQTTAFIIKVQDTNSTPRFNLPEVEGVTYGEVSQSTSNQIRIINGRRTESLTVTYQIPVRVSLPGVYNFPQWTVELDGKRYTITQQQLNVSQSPYFLRIANDEPIYVGQTAILSVELFVLEESVESIRQVGLPGLESDSFLMGVVNDEASQQTRRYQGKNYLVVSWEHSLTALRSGEQELEYSVPLAIYSARRGSSFNDSFFRNNSIFDRFNTEQRTVYSGPLKLTVEQLPAPQPESFTGAVGQFTVSTRLNATERTVGEPFSLFAEVTGKGNFERIEAPEFPSSPAFRTYPPKSEVETVDTYNVEGLKRFEILLDPLSAEATEIPGISFTYFDPQKEEYITIETDPLPIKINPAPENTRFRQPIIASNQPDQPLPELSNEPALLDIKKTPGKWVSAVAPSLKQPVVLATQAAPLLALSFIFFIRKRQLRLVEDTGYARLKKASRETREALSRADSAAQANDTEAFYSAAESALKHSLAKLSSSSSESLVASEVTAILQQHGAPADLCERVSEICNEAEQVKFAGGMAAASDLKARAASIKSIIQEVEALR